MSPIKKLARILTDEIRGEFDLTFEAEDGQIFRFRATEEQIVDLIRDPEKILKDDEEEDDLTESKELGDE
jgi:hypothetical protein